jgi:3-phosphoshikimate 1-carboxyvinyltransferase
MPGTAADVIVVRPAATVGGRLSVPGDKSISHRYALLAAVAHGPSVIEGYAPGADCAATLDCLRRLGVGVDLRGSTVRIEGHGFEGLRPPESVLYAANSGTTLRLLSGIVAGRPFRCVLDGDASLARRPMRRVVEPLVRMGASITTRDGRPPLAIDGGPLHGIVHHPEVPSAQVKSAVLLAGLQAAGRTSVLEPAPTRDHTERALEAFGAGVERQANVVAIDGGQPLHSTELIAPGDFSSAAFWIALAAATLGSDVQIDNVGLNPTRTALIEVVRRAGGYVEVEPLGGRDGEPVGRLHVGGGLGRGFSIDPIEVPALIDEIPALAALGALLPEGERMRVEGAGELRVKESDRIAGLAEGLRALGADVEEYPDGFQLVARPMTGATLDARGDHRLAMAFAIAATGARTPSTITGASAVGVSYPNFFDELARLAPAR